MDSLVRYTCSYTGIMALWLDIIMALPGYIILLLYFLLCSVYDFLVEAIINYYKTGMSNWHYGTKIESI